MAKTIYEMAVAYATEDGENGKPIVIKCEKDAFIFGANAVLEIFKEIIENRNFCAFPTSVHQELLDKIKELKGE